MNNYLASGGEIDLLQTNDICKWFPCDWGFIFKNGDDNKESLSDNLYLFKQTLHYPNYWSQPVIAKNTFTTIPKYNMDITNQLAISSN